MRISDWSSDVCSSDLGVLRAAAARENVEQTADLVVEIGDVGEIGAPGGTHLRLGDLEAAEIDGLQQALAVRILLLIRDRRDLGEQRRTVLVEIPELPPGHIGIVRSEEHPSELPSLMSNSYAVFCL